MTGVQILKPQFGSTLVLVVEIAWGADLTDIDGSGWTWTDVTTDVMIGDDQLSFTLGRSDEASTTQPAECTFTLDNRDNKYSQSPLGANYPYVRQGVPVRVRMILSGTSYTRFQGYATGFNPAWDPTGNYAVSKVKANGVLRRLQQGSDPLQSALRHSIPGLSNLAAYWPLEDGKNATAAASGLDDGQPMTVVAGTPAFANSSPFDCSDAVMQVKDAYLLGYLTNRTTNGVVQLRAVIQWPEDSSAAVNNTFVLRAHLTGTLVRLDVVYHTGSANLEVVVTARDGTVYASGAIGFDIDGTSGRLSVWLRQSGSDVEGQLSYLGIGASEAGYIDLTTITNQTLTGCYSVAIAPDQSQSNLVIGHVTVEDAVTDVFDLLAELNAYVAETAADRFTRLCGENNVDSTETGTLTTGLGAQSIDTFVNLAREIETANFGLLADGLSPGLKLFSRTVRENEAAALTIDMSNGEMPATFAPIDDDALLKNRWTVTRKGGATAVSQDTSGPLGTDVVGVYADSKTVNLKDDNANQFLADWLVHQFTTQGYRYPALPLDFHVTPTLASSWLASGGLWSRVDVTNADAVLEGLPAGTISLSVEGFTETIDQHTWHLDGNCSPYEPWRIAVVADETGDTGEFLMRLDTDGSTVHTGVSAGATSISVATSSGPLWTTTADDFPLVVEIGGIPVTVTGITGTSSPQTFTVTGSTVTKALTAGTSVSVWRETVLSI
jgi:hypothetical protein